MEKMENSGKNFTEKNLLNNHSFIFFLVNFLPEFSIFFIREKQNFVSSSHWTFSPKKIKKKDKKIEQNGDWKIKYTNINNKIAKVKDDYLEWQIKIKN